MDFPISWDRLCRKMSQLVVKIQIYNTSFHYYCWNRHTNSKVCLETQWTTKSKKIFRRRKLKDSHDECLNPTIKAAVVDTW